MDQQNPKNPHIADIIRTALATIAPPARNDAPSIMVTGSHNVISWGGTVYMRPANSPDEQGEQR